MPKTESDYTACHQCNRGGNGNDPDKCSCGWKVKRPGPYGCYIGTPIAAPRTEGGAT